MLRNNSADGIMSRVYVHQRIACAPRTWKLVANNVLSLKGFREAPEKSILYGIWRSQIGLPRDTITVISSWKNDKIATETAPQIFNELSLVESIETNVMVPTVRPVNDSPPKTQGNYAFRWFETPEVHFEEFLNLCKDAWPNFESKYDSQIIGLWKMNSNQSHNIKTLLLTRRPSLTMWERSKIPQGAIETEVRDKLNRRYDLCDWTTVYTTTLLTANDGDDNIRWS